MKGEKNQLVELKNDKDISPGIREFCLFIMFLKVIQVFICFYLFGYALPCLGSSSICVLQLKLKCVCSEHNGIRLSITQGIMA
jgi:hypothetical protein